MFDRSATPRLWVKRLAIFTSLQPVTPLRNIILKRGLNLIVGKQTFNPSLMHNPMSMAGHSVGKTTFCRLMRYCLGEQHFSTVAGEQRIRSSLPHSWVGAEVEIEGVNWAVLRPLGDPDAPSSAQSDATVEDCISTMEEGKGFNVYLKSLSKLLPVFVNHPEITYRWEHLLAWLARDQECRLRKFEVWRDAASGSGTSGFRKPKEYPVHLVRSMLELIYPKESEWSQKHADLLQQKKQCAEKYSVASQEAQYAYNEARKLLTEFIDDVAGTRPQMQLQLDSPSSHCEKRKTELRQKYKELENQFDDVEKRLTRARLYVENAKRQKEAHKALLVSTPPPMMAQTTSALLPIENNKQKLDELDTEINETENCPLAGYLQLRECTHIASYIEQLKKVTPVIVLNEASREIAIQKMAKEEQEKIRLIINTIDESERKLKAAKENVAAYESSRKNIMKQFFALENELDRLDRALKSFLKAEEWSLGLTKGTELQKYKEELEYVDAEIAHAKDQLDFYSAQSFKKSENLQQLFNGLVQRVLKADYSGKIKNSAEEFFPQVLRGNVDDGAAIESLSFILMDITAALGLSKGMGWHPAFLIHDSPREADLAIGPYHSLLIEMAMLTQETGGEQCAPFQYILTTTTEPPEELHGYVRLELAASPPRDMLLGQQLGRKIDTLLG